MGRLVRIYRRVLDIVFGPASRTTAILATRGRQEWDDRDRDSYTSFGATRPLHALTSRSRRLAPWR